VQGTTSSASRRRCQRVPRRQSCRAACTPPLSLRAPHCPACKLSGSLQLAVLTPHQPPAMLYFSAVRAAAQLAVRQPDGCTTTSWHANRIQGGQQKRHVPPCGRRRPSRARTRGRTRARGTRCSAAAPATPRRPAPRPRAAAMPPPPQLPAPPPPAAPAAQLPWPRAPPSCAPPPPPSARPPPPPPGAAPPPRRTARMQNQFLIAFFRRMSAHLIAPSKPGAACMLPIPDGAEARFTGAMLHHKAWQLCPDRFRVWGLARVAVTVRGWSTARAWRRCSASTSARAWASASAFARSRPCISAASAAVNSRSAGSGAAALAPASRPLCCRCRSAAGGSVCEQP
jgi:hypothetical protein